jgi:hypothetical protein
LRTKDQKTRRQKPLGQTDEMVGLDHCGQYKYRRITTFIFDVESEVRNNYGDEYEVKRDDERKDNDANIHEEAPNNPNILI